MNLEVVSSSLTIYLISKHLILDIKSKESYKYIAQTILTYKYLHSYWGVVHDTSTFKITNLYSNIILQGTLKNRKIIQQLPNAIVKKKHKLIHKKTFISYLNISIYNHTNVFKVHPSFNHLYVRQSVKGSYTINLLKFFSNWLNISSYLYNTLFYKLNPLLFGTVFFKNEINSLNWLSLPKLNINIRLNKTLIFTTPIKRNSISSKVVRILFTLNSNTSFILDTNYHKSTLDYLHKLSIFTVGIVPTFYNAKVVDLALPISVDNIFSQLFIIKLITQTSKLVEYDRYNFYKKLWHSYKL